MFGKLLVSGRGATRFGSITRSMALGGCLLVTILLVERQFHSGAERLIDTTGWSMRHFVEHCEQKGLQLRVIPIAHNGNLDWGAFLTEDQNATWNSLQQKMMLVERIADWRGTVQLTPTVFRTEEGVADLLFQWGECGWRIGDFLLFGDQEVIQRVRSACRQ